MGQATTRPAAITPVSSTDPRRSVAARRWAWRVVRVVVASYVGVGLAAYLGAEHVIIHVSHGHRLFAAAPEPRRLLVVEGAMHGEAADLAGPRLAEAMQWLVGEEGEPAAAGRAGAP